MWYFSSSLSLLFLSRAITNKGSIYPPPPPPPNNSSMSQNLCRLPYFFLLLIIIFYFHLHPHTEIPIRSSSTFTIHRNNNTDREPFILYSVNYYYKLNPFPHSPFYILILSSSSLLNRWRCWFRITSLIIGVLVTIITTITISIITLGSFLGGQSSCLGVCIKRRRRFSINKQIHHRW